MAENTTPGVLNGKFRYKKLPDGSLEKTKVVCIYCSNELPFHRRTTSLKYHLWAKHILADVSKDASADTASTSRALSSENVNKLVCLSNWLKEEYIV